MRTMVMERAQKDRGMSKYGVASSDRGPHAVGGAQRERSAF
jgi:hypothetical protein